MKTLRRLTLMLALAAALSGSAVAATGCGSGAHYLGGIAAHHIANHFTHTPAARRRVNKVFCLYHGHRVLVDLRTHHVFAAGLNALAAYRARTRGFGRRH